MTLHAIDDIDDAIDATRALLFPFDLRTWLKLAFVVFFIGGGSGALNLVQNANSFNNFGQGPSSTPSGGEFALTGTLDVLPTLTGESLAQFTPPGPGGEGAAAGLGVFVIVAVLAAVLFALVVGVLSNFMEFVFVQSLIEQEVHVRRYFGENVGNGLRLLVFRLVFGILTLLVAAVVFLLFALLITGGELADLGPQILAVSVPFLIVGFLLFAVVTGVVSGFTTVFVVPLMLQGDHGIVEGWRRLLGSISDHPKQYLAYLALSVVLGIGVSIVGAFLGVAAVVVLGIPFGVVAAAAWFGLGQGLAAGVVTGIVVAAFLLALLVVANLIKAPLQAFLRYYAMLVLGDIDESMDPMPEVRERIRD